MSVQLTPRDLVVLTIVAEMYGAPMDLVAQMLDVSESRAYKIVRRWRLARMVSELGTRPVPGPSWIFPTRSMAEALLDRQLSRQWLPTPKMAEHTRTVLQVRLALVGLDLDRWVSERALRAELPAAAPGQKRPHVHDGRYLRANGEWRAVEVELTAKNLSAAKAALHSAHVAAVRAECAALVYFCRGEATKSVLRTAYEQLPLDKAVPVISRDVDELITPKKKTVERPGLRVVDGGAHEGRAS